MNSHQNTTTDSSRHSLRKKKKKVGSRMPQLPKMAVVGRGRVSLSIPATKWKKSTTWDTFSGTAMIVCNPKLSIQKIFFSSPVVIHVIGDGRKKQLVLFAEVGQFGFFLVW